MAVFLFVLCVLCFFSGVITAAGSETIFQQIVGAISFVNAAILLIGAAITNSLDKVVKGLNELKPNSSTTIKSN